MYLILALMPKITEVMSEPGDLIKNANEHPVLIPYQTAQQQTLSCRVGSHKLPLLR